MTVNIWLTQAGCWAKALFLAKRTFRPCAQEVGRRRQTELAAANRFFRQKPMAYRTREKEKGTERRLGAPVGVGQEITVPFLAGAGCLPPLFLVEVLWQLATVFALWTPPPFQHQHIRMKGVGVKMAQARGNGLVDS